MDINNEQERIEFTKESTWFDNFYAYWIIELRYDGKHWEPIKTKIAISLSLKTWEDADKKADEIIAALQPSTLPVKSDNECKSIWHNHHVRMSHFCTLCGGATLIEKNEPSTLPLIETEALLDEIWDDCSEYIDTDIDSLQHFAGSSVITRMGYQKLREKLKSKSVPLIDKGSEEKDLHELIVDGIMEGSEQWKAEYDNCRAILKELAELKSIKDNEGKTDEYLHRQPKAWEDAVSFLSKYTHF